MRCNIFALIFFLCLGMNPSWAQPVLLRCVPSTTKPPKPKEVMMIVVDSEHHAIKTESLSADKPRKRMTFHIEEMNESMIAGRKLSPKKEFVLELNRKTGHLVETEDAQEPILYDCEAP